MGRFLSFIFSQDTDRIATWAVENRAALVRTGSLHSDPLIAARRFADYCIRNAIDTEPDPDNPVGYWRADGGLYQQAKVHQGDAPGKCPVLWSRWIGWRWRLLRESARKDAAQEAWSQAGDLAARIHGHMVADEMDDVRAGFDIGTTGAHFTFYRYRSDYDVKS